MLTGGEPMMHPHFFEIGRMARDLGFVTRIRTNGHSLNQKQVYRVKKEVDPYMVEVSLHGASAEVHDRQTQIPGSFDRLVENLEIAVKTGLRCSVVSTPTAWNEHQVEEMFALCDLMGVPLRFQGPVAPRDNGDTSPLAIQPAAETWDKVTELISARRAKASHPGSDPAPYGSDPIEANRIEDKPEQPAMCGVGVAGVDIDPYGNVQACMHLQESAGNLHQQSIKEIWNNSPLFKRARARSVAAAEQFVNKPPQQYGAPLFCIAVEENAKKGCGSCGGGCS
jgi:MoaA/NifB/PqqE/SkfB family radical SAM enzyme